LGTTVLISPRTRRREKAGTRTSRESPSDPLPIVLGIDIEPCYTVTRDADKADHAVVSSSDVLVRLA
jgi:hypothetical protein